MLLRFTRVAEAEGQLQSPDGELLYPGKVGCGVSLFRGLFAADLLILLFSNWLSVTCNSVPDITGEISLSLSARAPDLFFS